MSIQLVLVFWVKAIAWQKITMALIFDESITSFSFINIPLLRLILRFSYRSFPVVRVDRDRKGIEKGAIA